MSITVNDPLFSTVSAELNAINPTFLSDVVNLINRSPTLVGEIPALDATPSTDHGQTTIYLTNTAGEGSDTSYHNPAINISCLSTYNDAPLLYAGGSLIAPYDQVTSASMFVGSLGYELGHWFDVGLANLTTGGYSLYSTEQAVMTEFASEGTSGY